MWNQEKAPRFEVYVEWPSEAATPTSGILQCGRTHLISVVHVSIALGLMGDELAPFWPYG